MPGEPPVVRHLEDLSASLIAPGDNVRLCTLAGPEQGSDTSVFLEIWDPGGSQPLNSHPDSAEIFIVLSGTARAHSDHHTTDLTPGDILILQPGSEHRIINTSPTTPLHTLTIMSNDNGFAALVSRGTSVPLSTDDIQTLATGFGIS
ncbi:cupin domain-containing protein [Nocardia macrotermitis]|uniref:Cupin type-2 domain-containing protein n=1 Tax=Nocardia macrotermitis TaxID=2585198 RepID=A0A7K0CZK4_9NOCA|nr:cupin domain-containing protein [Nocardia macrotermitis]MQY18392.1 hypothetical protein [Nocardia macrotermitis]